MWGGAFLSAAGHAAVIALALWALPWLRVRPEPPPPVVAVSLVAPGEFAALARKPVEAARPVPVAPPDPASRPPAKLPAELPAAPEREPEPEAPAPDDLAPFDSAAPLGIGGRRPVAEIGFDGPAVPRAEESPADAAPADDPAAALAHFEAGVRQAVLAGRVYPELARARGLAGTVGVQVTVGRHGNLVSARLSRPSGSQTLNRAALEATLRARLPMAPPEIAGARFVFDVGLAFPP